MDVVTLGPVAFSNRDLATIYWLVIFSVWVTAKPDIRASLGRVVRTGSIFLLPLSLYSLWVGALIYGAWQLGWWDPTVIKDTVVWFIVSGLTLFFSFVRAGSEKHFFRRTVLATVRVTALLEVYLNPVAFPVWVELLMQPLLLFLLLISIVAARDEQARSVQRFADVLLAILGLSIVVATTVQLLGNWQSRDMRETLLSFLLPIWLTLGVLPFIWGLSAWSNYDSAFRQVRFFSPDPRLSWRARFVLFRTFHFRHRQLRPFPRVLGTATRRDHHLARRPARARRFPY